MQSIDKSRFIWVDVEQGLRAWFDFRKTACWSLPQVEKVLVRHLQLVGAPGAIKSLACLERRHLLLQGGQETSRLFCKGIKVNLAHILLLLKSFMA